MFITECEDFQVYQFVWDIINSNCFVICGRQSLFIVDPIDSEEFYQFVQKQPLQKAIAILTHSHYDHISGLNKLKQIIPNCIVVASKVCSENIQNPKKNLSNIADAIIKFQCHVECKGDHNEVREKLVQPFSCNAVDKTFEKEMDFVWEGHSVFLASYHGHSKDSACSIVDKKYLFSGDTLLPIPTVTRLPGGSTARFWEEDIPKLKKMINQIVKVFPGHEMPGMLKDMLAVNVKPARYRQSEIV